MGLFNDIGTFFTKTIPNVVTRDIPNLVTKEIPKVVTKDIPRIVTKDIPRLVTKEIPEVFTQDIPKLVTKDIPDLVTKGIPDLVTRDIPRVVTEDLPKLLVEDIPDYLSEDVRHMTDRSTYEPAIKALRKNVDNLETSIASERGAFLEQRALYDQKRSCYRQLSEDYSGKDVKAANLRVGHVADEDWDDMLMSGDRVLKGVDNSFRFVANFVTFGIAEMAWTPAEARKEYEFLSKRQAALRSVVQRLRRAKAELQQVCKDYDASIATIRSRLGNTDDIEEALNDQTLQEAQQAAGAETAVRLFQNGATIQQAELFTGLSTAQLEELARKHLPKEPVDVRARKEITVRELIDDGMSNFDIKALTQLSDEEIESMRASRSAAADQQKKSQGEV